MGKEEKGMAIVKQARSKVVKKKSGALSQESGTEFRIPEFMNL